MPFEKGHNTKSPGRPPGSKNKATEEVRKKFLQLVKANQGNLQGWIEETAKKDPAKAVELIIKISGFVLPQLQKMELTGEDGEELFKNIRFEFGTSDDK